MMGEKMLQMCNEYLCSRGTSVTVTHRAEYAATVRRREVHRSARLAWCVASCSTLPEARRLTRPYSVE